MPLHLQEGPYGQPDVMAWCFGATGLTPFDTTKLLDTPIIVFNGPGTFRPRQPGQAGHGQVIGSPVFHVTVWGDHPEHRVAPVGVRDLALCSCVRFGPSLLT